MSEVLFKEESYRILGACFNVYREKGCGFLEAVYQECLAIAFEEQSVPHVEQKPLTLRYRGRTLRQTYKTNFICYGKILLEIMAVAHLTDEHRAQTLNYLHATEIRLGLFLNFGHHPKLEHERFIIGSPVAEPLDLAS